MNDPKLNKKFAVSDGPVNRRLMVPDDTPGEQDSPIALARIQATLARQRLGASMAERLSQARGPSATGGSLSTGDIAVVVGGAASAVGLTLGLIQGSILLGGAGVVCLCGFGLRAFMTAKSRRAQSSTESPQIEALIQAKDVEQLDAALHRLAGDAPQDLLDRLARLKELIARCVALVAHSKEGGGVSNDDSFFIREAVRRYLPDSIASYLRVPKKDRASLVIEEGKTASDLMHAQLDMIEQQLTAKEIRLTQMAGESLMRQQRFLAAKTRTPTR